MRHPKSASVGLIPLHQHARNILEKQGLRRSAGAAMHGLSFAKGATRMAGFRRQLGRRSASASALAICFLIGILGNPSSSSAQDAPPRVTLRTLEGTPFSLESVRGEIVVLDFWATWCVPCRTSTPFFDGLLDRYGKQGVRVLGLTLEDNEDAVRSFLADVPVRFTILRDPSGASGEAFQVVAMPTTFLLDPDGRIAARFEGGDRKAHEAIETAVAALVAGKPLPTGVDRRVAKSLRATGPIKAWQRGYLADPMMNLDGDAITRMLREHIHASKEGAAGDGGPSGGGCGCN